MFPNYVQELPLPNDSISPKLRALLTPIGLDPFERPEVSSRYEHDQYGPEYEAIHMIMALTDGPETISVDDFDETSDGVVSFSTPVVDECGSLVDPAPNISGHDYVIASSGNGSFYTYNLAEKVWMTLGLSPRCVGGNYQKIIYDDLSLPEFGVAEGEVSSSYHFSSSRNVSWRMSNEYLRDYLWMRGRHGTRVFFYESNITETPDVAELLGTETHINFKPEGGWYDLCIQRINGKVLVQLWAVVCAISPEKCQLQSADSLIWPGVSGPVNRQRANALVDPSIIYLDDRFLQRYEQNSFYETTPFEDYGSWTCNPSYLGQWTFTDCRRIGRNLIKVGLRELYKGKPDREIVWAHSHSVAQAVVDQTNLEEEHIVAKVQRFLDALLDFADGIAWLAGELGSDGLSSEELIGISREELRAERWLPYPKLSRLAQVAPLDMTEQQFLSRCKEIHELWQRLPNGVIRKIVDQAGHDSKQYKGFGSLKLLQVLANVLDRLNSNHEEVSNFDAGHQDAEVTCRNSRLGPLFLTADLRNADAHIGGSISQTLSDFGFDITQTNSGYGKALDYVFDRNIESFRYIASEINALRKRSF
ncbi:hypothetical protein [Phaeobacter inhibens]|uniref:hypothetical protein n=1 Tax=Phaeobacter inhibens TaxID=221822 RepID=UPI00076BB5BA|nr:hypothetical protein [Phaeobacter inhibens]KXF92253.1 hypothetical protein AT574_02740 [Phaeobacter inhibens]WHP66901.1 hypothetical protein QMZ01_10035 [Phaeobacter inhibens]